MRRELIEEELTKAVIGAFFDVYNHLGFGFLEHLYVMAMERELLARGHRVLHAAASRQIYNYLRATQLEVGLLLHFGPEPRFYRHVLSNQKKTWFSAPDQPVLIRSAPIVMKAADAQPE